MLQQCGRYSPGKSCVVISLTRYLSAWNGCFNASSTWNGGTSHRRQFLVTSATSSMFLLLIFSVWRELHAILVDSLAINTYNVNWSFTTWATINERYGSFLQPVPALRESSTVHTENEPVLMYSGTVHDHVEIKCGSSSRCSNVFCHCQLNSGGPLLQTEEALHGEAMSTLARSWVVETTTTWQQQKTATTTRLVSRRRWHGFLRQKTTTKIMKRRHQRILDNDASKATKMAASTHRRQQQATSKIA